MENATVQAQKLNDQIYKLGEPYEGNYSFVPFYQMTNLKIQFTDNLGASKGVLGNVVIKPLMSGFILCYV